MSGVVAQLGPGGLTAWAQVLQQAGRWPARFTLRPYGDGWEASVVAARASGDRIEVEVDARWTAQRGGLRHAHHGVIRLHARPEGGRLVDWQLSDEAVAILADWAARTEHDELPSVVLSAHAAWSDLEVPDGVTWSGSPSGDDLVVSGPADAFGLHVSRSEVRRGDVLVEAGAPATWTVHRQAVDAFHAIDHVLSGTVVGVTVRGTGKARQVEVRLGVTPGRRRVTLPLVLLESDDEVLRVQTPDGVEHALPVRWANAAIANGRMARPELPLPAAPPPPPPRAPRARRRREAPTPG